MSIVLVGSTSGSITLQEPAVSGNTVLSLPAVSGTLITTGSSGQSIPKAALPTGSVLQVVNATFGTYTSTSSTNPVDTGLTASITPTSSSSKILAFVSINGCEKGNNTASIRFRLVRNSTDIFSFENIIFGATSSPVAYGNTSTSYLDSPSTTSATTYKVQWNVSNGSGTIYINNYGAGGAGTTNCTLTLMEIAA